MYGSERSVCAFANADGGELYIGFDEIKAHATFSWRGFSRIEDANGHIQTLENLFPLGKDFNYTFFSCLGMPGYVLHISIQKTADIKAASDNVYYLRRGAQNLPQTSEEQITRLRRNKGITSFEVETVPVSHNIITNSVPLSGFMLEIVPTSEPEQWLRKQLLIHEDKPTVGGVLLFAEEPQAIIPKRCGIKIYRYRTKNVGTRDTLAFNPITIEGCLYDQIFHAVEKTVEIIETIPTLGEGGLEKITYPKEALHELITNAVLHRDYSITNDIHIRIFDNRIEVESPGRLPAHITTKNILSERFARNPTIVRLINKFPNPPNKDVGEGLNTAFQSMRKLRLKEPIISEMDNSVIVNIRHESLASPEETVIEYLETHESINNSKGREICNVGSENVMKRTFARLIKEG